MARPVRVQAQIEINASPSAVRSVFLNFSRYKVWTPGWSISAADPETKPANIQAGSSLKVNMSGMAFRPTVVENTSERFVWDGSLWGLVVGRHAFAFSPSEKTAGGTTLVQSEVYTGPLMIFFRPWSAQMTTSPNFEAFNEALKKEVENPTPQEDEAKAP